MTRDEFQKTIHDDPRLSEPIHTAAAAASPQQFGVITEAAVVALMFPVARFVVMQVGLPWLYELGRYSELQRRRVHQWIDARYREEGIDPDQAEAASEKLMDELEATTDASVRGAWEHLRELLKEGEVADDE